MPSGIAEFKVVILWQHELIAAAKALHKMTLDKPTAEDAANAMKACFAAIYSPELASGACPLTIMNALEEPRPAAAPIEAPREKEK
jgi:hypothetical protein